mmetsp:Transcript_39235/g.54481  ORF Transcript_39235/g.54481 Transcript_39235/m.54481 type:complete len:605 (-) Transcript_39235:57-1871(-)|eukprot:CAMPEP_0196586876 /NCGR_PEP_ID=MMETSP1081-20130531/55849_1 /TAXON_ID=36882 /ORGANISM="Pyramimonas amylifera, Strain CCMP720" /LENGTH=604 /DNA_ID=CAMNT_0041908891 /DNA_START=67 /DNA_END=1881 /DNA_ORIENTATION=-
METSSSELQATLELQAMKNQLESIQAGIVAKEEEVSRLRAEQSIVAPYSKCCGRSLIKNIIRSEDGGISLVGKTLIVGGWVKTGRMAEKNTILFLELNDGSTSKNIQVLVRSEIYNLDDLKHTGTSIIMEGQIVSSPPQATGQAVEMHATSVKSVGKCDAKLYPIAKKKMTLEYLRSVSHLRARTNTIAAVTRIRNAVSFATHAFFQQNDFLYIHTPIITCSDCEGAGEMFQVTTLLSGADKAADAGAGSGESAKEALAAMQTKVSELGSAVKVAKEAAKESGDSAGVAPALALLTAAKKDLEKLQKDALVVGGIKRTPEGKIDYTEDFFGKKAFMTVSGQLQVETFACGVGNVYTFGPTFRAENSHTSRHLAEFWMIEPELAFADLEDDMRCAEDYVQFCCKYLLANCYDDLEFISKMYDKEAIPRLQAVASTPFARITYTAAVELLLEHLASGAVKQELGQEFENPLHWGCDLASEHERYLAERVFKRPTIVYNYPKEIKAFYMRLNDDNKTVAAMDVLVPKVGELIGGSQREERLEVCEQRIAEMGLFIEDYSWYMDLRRFGSMTHSGFGLGFERMILFATGIENIRDVIPFPRWPNNADL